MSSHKHNLLETGATGLLVSIVTGVITLIVLLIARYAILPLNSEILEIGMGSLVAAGAIALQLWVQGQLSAKIYQSKKREYVSKWNLAAAYPIAAAIYSTFILILGVWSLFLGYGFRLPEKITLLGGALIAGVGLLAYLIAIGSSLNWANSWQAKTGKLVTICVGALSWIAITAIVALLVIGSGVSSPIGGSKSTESPGLEAELGGATREINTQLEAGYYLKADPAGKLYQCKEAQADTAQCKPIKLSAGDQLETGVDNYWPEGGKPKPGEAINQVIIRKAYNPQCSALIEQSSDGKIIRQSVECD